MTDQKLLGALHSWGADSDAAIKRLIGDEEFYIELLIRFVNGIELKEAKKFFLEGDYRDSFILIHRMKGSAADLSLNPLYEVLDPLTEELRPYSHEKLSEREPDKKRIEELFDRLEGLIESLTGIVPTGDSSGSYHP